MNFTPPRLQTFLDVCGILYFFGAGLLAATLMFELEHGGPRWLFFLSMAFAFSAYWPIFWMDYRNTH